MKKPIVEKSALLLVIQNYLEQEPAYNFAVQTLKNEFEESGLDELDEKLPNGKILKFRRKKGFQVIEVNSEYIKENYPYDELSDEDKEKFYIVKQRKESISFVAPHSKKNIEDVIEGD